MYRSRLPYALTLGLLCLGWALPRAPFLAGECRAARVKVWHHTSPTHHDKTRFQRALVSSEGTLRLSRQLQPLAGLDATHVWALAEDRDGNLWAATGDAGKVYKVPAGST